MLNLVIPAAGAGRRFLEAGFSLPKPLISIAGEPMLSHVLRNVMPKKYSGNDYELCEDPYQVKIVPKCRTILLAHPEVLSHFKGTFNVSISVKDITEGAACTVLLAKKYIDNDDPLLLVNSDQLIQPWSATDFIDHGMRQDGAIVAFESDGNPKWSYIDFDAELSRVTRVSEKQPISKWATAGIYFWRRGSDFVRSAEAMIAANERVLGEFYVAPTFNRLIQQGMSIAPYLVPAQSVKGLGTPGDLEAFVADK